MAMRTRSRLSSSWLPVCRARWAEMAASRASGAVGKAAQKASPTVLKTKPPRSSMASLRISSWRASTSDMASGLLSQSLVEPSMSVKRKVTVPVGGLGTVAFLQGVSDGLLDGHRPPLLPRFGPGCFVHPDTCGVQVRFVQRAIDVPQLGSCGFAPRLSGTPQPRRPLVLLQAPRQACHPLECLDHA